MGAEGDGVGEKVMVAVSWALLADTDTSINRAFHVQGHQACYTLSNSSIGTALLRGGTNQDSGLGGNPSVPELRTAHPRLACDQ